MILFLYQNLQKIRELEKLSQIKQAVILAAGGRKPFEQPVGFLELEESTIIERIITILNSNGIDQVTIIQDIKKNIMKSLLTREI